MQSEIMCMFHKINKLFRNLWYFLVGIWDRRTVKSRAACTETQHNYHSFGAIKCRNRKENIKNNCQFERILFILSHTISMYPWLAEVNVNKKWWWSRRVLRMLRQLCIHRRMHAREKFHSNFKIHVVELYISKRE